MNLLEIIGRRTPLFAQDINNNEANLLDLIKNSKILVVGAAGSIGQAVTIELFKRNPNVLHAVDISENNLVELVRNLRSSIGYCSTDFKTFAIDCGSIEFEALCNWQGPYDYIFNLSALKHVRSESDPFTLMRMIKVNVLNTINVLRLSHSHETKKYFCVSTDKAANPVNMMGASKKIMEEFLMRESLTQKVSMARFANVAFSDGSLLHGFNQRFVKKQPLTAPDDVRRYFITPNESGELCILSGFLGENRDIFFPKQSEELILEKFSSIALRYLNARDYEPYICESEEEARSLANDLINKKKWPVYFFQSDTTGEKDFEEFYTDKETLVLDKFENIGIIQNPPNFENDKLNFFIQEISHLSECRQWDKQQILGLFNIFLEEFSHKETGKYLDNRM